MKLEPRSLYLWFTPLFMTLTAIILLKSKEMTHKVKHNQFQYYQM